MGTFSGEEADPTTVLEMLRADLIPHGRLISGGLELTVAHYEETFRAMDERHRKLAWYSFCLTPELFLAMDILPFLGESHPVVVTRASPEVCWDSLGMGTPVHD